MLKLKCCFTSTETVGLLGTGAQDVHLDFHTAPELCAQTGVFRLQELDDDFYLQELDDHETICP